MEKLFHMTVWGKDSNAPNGYKYIYSTTVEAISGLEAARKVGAWNHWGDSVWFSSPENGGRPEIIIRNDTPE